MHHRSSSESSLTSFLSSSDSDSDEKTKLPNPQKRRNFDFKRPKTNNNEFVSSTPLHRNIPHLKTDNWPSPIIPVLYSQFSTVKRKNDKNTGLPSLRMQETSMSEQPIIELQNEKELRLLKRKSSMSRYKKQNENNQGEIETVRKQAVHAENGEDINRLKKILSGKGVKNVGKTRGYKMGNTEATSSPPVKANKERKTAVRRTSPRKVQSSINQSETKHVNKNVDTSDNNDAGYKTGNTEATSSTPVKANKEIQTVYHPAVRRTSPRRVQSSINQSETKHVNKNVDTSDNNDAGYKMGNTEAISSTPVKANKERKTAVRRTSPRKVQSSINQSETKHVNKNVDTSDNNDAGGKDVSAESSAMWDNSNEIIKRKNDSPKKVKRNPLPNEQSPKSRPTTNSVSGRKKQAYSNDFGDEDFPAESAIWDNSNEMIKSKNASPKKVKRNPLRKVQSPKSGPTTNSVSRRKKQAASIDFEIKKNDKTGKESNKERKATRITSHTKTGTNEEFAIPENGFRRSIRRKIKPISYWKGERVQYEIGLDSCRTMVGVKCEESPENSNYVQKNSNNNRKKKKNEDFNFGHFLTSRVRPGRVMIPIPSMGSEINLECFSTIRFDDKISGESDQRISVFNSLEIPGIECGYISIGSSAQITNTAVGKMQFVFCVMSGKLSVTIHNTNKNLIKGDCFLVPEGVSYSVENNEDFEAVISFIKIEH